MKTTSDKQSGKCWYTRRDGVMRGPFTAKNISRYILLGRIRLDDELSQDRETWVIAGHLDSLLPAELINQSSWDDYQQLVTAHIEVDERNGDRRSEKRKNYLDDHAEKRISPERRRSNVDSGLLSQHLLAKSMSADEQRSVARRKRPVLLFVVLLVTLMFAWLSPIQS
jgi:hypothetical protein